MQEFYIWLLVGIGGVIIFAILIKNRKQTSNSAISMLKSDVTELTRSVTLLQNALTDKIDRNNTTMQSSMQRQLSESSRLIADVSHRLTKLDDTNRRVVDVADELKTLQNVLQNPKQRGVFGEYYLESVLQNILPPGQFQMQYKFSDGEIADAVVFLDKGQVLAVDSKFSLENYNRMVAAKDKTEREHWYGKVRADLKGRIDETSKYVRRSENTMEFAFMFIPSEAVYYDLLINTVGTGAGARDLIEYAFRDKKVIIVSPTSFMAYLQTVLQGLRSLQIEEQAKDIQVRVGKLSTHIARYEEYMQKLGNSLGATVNHYNAAHKEFKKVDKDVVKIAQTTEVVEPLEVDKPQKD
ncbi:DNA recombination protein RmuC [Candidatus Saccharibacteria bacterium]|nr:DNA recombination protein RmuC [Candidatus Saccharibacteria bacterium]